MYRKVAGYWNLTDEAVEPSGCEASHEQIAGMEGELASGRRFVQRYLIPKLERLRLGRIKILSVGCGLGEDVAEFRRQGYEAYGFDLWGFRASRWPELDRPSDWYYIADARKLPFEDKSFDIVLCIGLIEHVGAVGDGFELYPDWRAQRATFLNEVLRVAKRGVLLETPNRTFPADLNHIATRNKLLLWLGRKTGVHFHSTFEPFYLSYGDIEAYLASQSATVTPWELTNYFGFAIRKSRPWVRLIIPVLNMYFRILDRSPSPIRKSWLNPWVSVFITPS